MPETSPNRPLAAATGRLAKTPVLHLLVYAQERKLVGTLELESPGGTSAVLFIEGQPAKARTPEPVAYLGRVMLELGFLTDEQLNRSLLELARTKRLHGQILLEAGLIKEPQLHKALREQLLRKLQYLLTLPPETTYAYYDGFDSLHDYGGEEQLGIDPFPLAWSAVREAPPWEHVHAALTRVAQVQLRLSSRAQLQRFGFDKNELALLDILRGRPMRVSELIATGILKPREAQLLTYCLLITQQLQVVQSDGSYPPRLDPTPSARPAPITAPPIPEATISAPKTPSGSHAMSFSLRAAVTTAPSFLPPAHDAPQPSPTPAPTASGRPSPLPASHRSSRPPVGLSMELAQRKKEIVERAATIDREDYFTMLDLDRDATTDQVRERFFGLAKIWHPDRIPTALRDVHDACSRVFGRMSEAHQTLSDEERRERYMRLLKDGGATPEAQATIASVVEAATNFQKAEICMKRNDLTQAESLVMKAVEADPQQPEYIALAAWLTALKPENQTPAATMLAIAELDKAIHLSNRCERAYFYRGQLYKRNGSSRQAVKDFRKAADLNPRNIDAAREVRLFEMRVQRGSVPPPAPKKGQSEPAKPGGIFGKLFKK